MPKRQFIPAPGQVSHGKSSFSVGDVVGVVKTGSPMPAHGYVGIIDHIYKETSNRTMFVIRYGDGTSESIASARFYNIEEANRIYHAVMDIHSNGIEELKYPKDQGDSY